MTIGMRPGRDRQGASRSRISSRVRSVVEKLADHLLGRLVHSHRLLHRNLQTGLAGLKDSATPANFDQLRSAQEELKEQLCSIEVVILRLDTVAQALSAAATGPKRRSAEPATTALLVLVAVAAGGSFALELLRFIL